MCGAIKFAIKVACKIYKDDNKFKNEMYIDLDMSVSVPQIIKMDIVLFLL